MANRHSVVAAKPAISLKRFLRMVSLIGGLTLPYGALLTPERRLMTE
jgi:hypothetical protein